MMAAAIGALVLFSGAALARGGGSPPSEDAKPAAKPAAPLIKPVKPAGLEGAPAKDVADHGEPRTPPALPAPRGSRGPVQGGAAPSPATPQARRATPAAPAPAPAAPSTSVSDDTAITTADAALAALQAGNERWQAGTPTNPNTGMLRRKMTAEEGQKPFASILTCADSRIPVERVFDRGVGELFVVRVAGNVTNPGLTGTLEYGVGHLHTPLLVVMGHSKCGAVKATIDTMNSAKAAAGEGQTLPPNIEALVASIRPAVERARKQHPTAEGAELQNLAVRENVWQTIFDLYQNSPELVKMVDSGKLTVIGAVLDVSTGKVEWMGEHPWQTALVTAFKGRAARDVASSPPPAPGAGSAGASAAQATAPTDDPEHAHP
jgi:carbonic anhydrase